MSDAAREALILRLARAQRLLDQGAPYKHGTDEGAACLEAAELLRSAQDDPGTEKLLRDLLDRGYKMHVMAGTTTRLSEQSGDQNDPLLAWLSDVRSVLYGGTRPEPSVGTMFAPASTERKAR